MGLVHEIIKHIILGKMDKAIEKLMEYAKSQDRDFNNMAILIASQYNDWKKSKKIGLDPEPEELREIKSRIIQFLPDTKEFDYEILNFSVGDIPKEGVALTMEDIPLSDSKIFKRGVAGIERKFNWLCKIFLNIEHSAFKMPDLDNKLQIQTGDKKFYILVDQVEIKQNLEVYSKNANTERSFGFWNMKAAKDTEFWSNVNQKSKDMICERLKNDLEFRMQFYEDLQKLIAKKLDYKSSNDIKISSIRVYDGTSVNFDS